MDVVEKVLARFESEYSGLRVNRRKLVRNIEIASFLGSTGDDYDFSIRFSEPDFLCISADLRSSRPEGTETFWHRPYDEYHLSWESEVLENAVFDELNLLLTADTRVIQKVGFVSVWFSLQYLSADQWTHFYRAGAIRFNFDYPRIDGKTKIYSSKRRVVT